MAFPSSVSAPASSLQDAGHHHDHEQRDRQENLPAEPHQLVVAIPRDERLHQGDHEEDEAQFRHEPNDAGNPSEGDEGNRREPAAKEEDGHHRAHRQDRDIFAEKEQQEGRGGILDGIARDELRFRFDQVEGRAVRFGQGGYEEDDEHRQQGKPVPPEQAPARILRKNDFGEVQRAGAQQYRNNDEADRDLVGDHLRRRAERRQKGIFRIRRPAGHDNPINPERGDGEEIEYADIDVADRPALAYRNYGPGRERENGGHQGRKQEHALVGAGRYQRL